MLGLLEEFVDEVAAGELLQCGDGSAAGDRHTRSRPTIPRTHEHPGMIFHHTFPAPGVYEGEMTDALALRVVQFTVPSKFAVAACTLTVDAVTSTVALALIRIWPPLVNTMLHPFEWANLTSLALSSSTSLCPLFIERVTLAAP